MNKRYTVAALAAALLHAAPAASQEVVWSTLSANVPGGTFTHAVLPLEGGQVLGVRSSFSSFAPVEWFLLSREGQEGSTTPIQSNGFLADFCGLADDGSGGAFLLISEFTGDYGGPTLGAYDAVVLRIDSAGQLTGAQRFGGGGRDVGRAILADGAGGFFLAGDTESSGFGTPSGAVRDAFVAHVDAGGTMRWIRREGSGQLPGHMDALALDGNGGVLCGGSFDDDSNFPVVPRGFAAGYDSAGTPLFLHSIHPSGGMPIAIEPTSTGYVELAFGPFGGYFCTGRSSTGAPLWDVRLDSTSGSTPSDAISLVKRKDGTFLIGGRTTTTGTRQHIRGFSEGGNVLFDATYPDPAGGATSLQRLALDGLGSVFVAGSTNVVGGPFGIRARVDRIALDTIGSPGCTGQPNSTGSAARTQSVGSDTRDVNQLTIFTDGIPPASAGYYLSSLTSDLVPAAGGSQGDLCLGGSIGRLNRAGEVQLAGLAGRFHLTPDLGSLPSPMGTVSALAGDTWFFQAWYRDVNPSLTSNFSSSVEVQLN